MAVTLALTANYSNASGAVIAVNASGMASGYTAIEYQICNRPDFQFCIAPVFSAGASATLYYINQDTSYYVRARSVLSSGAREPWGPVLGARTPLFASPNTAPSGVLIQPAMIVVPEPVLRWVCASIPVGGYPVENLGRPSPVAFRTYDTVSDPEVLTFDMVTAGGPVDTIAVLNTNMPESATCIIRAGADENNVASGSPSFEFIAPFRASANLGSRNGYHGLFRLPFTINYPYIRVLMVTRLPGLVGHIEHAVAGQARMSKNFSGDMTETPIDLGVLSRGRSGNADRIPGFRMRKVSFDLSFITEAQFETRYRDLGWRVGSTDPVLVVPNSKAVAFLHDRLLYGALSASKYVNPTSPRWTTSFTVDSII